MKKILSLILASVLALSVALTAAGAAGTTFSELYSSELQTIDYVDSTLTALTTFAMNCELGLVYFDNFGLLRPGVAKNWSISEDGTVYTFYLRDDVWWVDSTGEKVALVTAGDFVTAAKHILNPDDPKSVANTLYNNLVGAKDYFDKVTEDFSAVGIKALDDTTLQYTLIGPSAYFLRMLGNNVWYPVPTDFLAEHEETYGTSCEDLLYNGAYYCSSYE